MSVNNYKNTSNILKFIIPSLLGVFLFLTPISSNGETTIPIAYLANFTKDHLQNALGEHFIIYMIVTIIMLSAILSLIFSFKQLNRPFLNHVFKVNIPWLIIRVIAAVIAILTVLNMGPEMINSEVTGALLLYELMPTLLIIFFFAGFLLPLLLNYGLLEFIGTLCAKFMRPLFTLPGRSAVDNLASWVGDGTIGVILTSNQYEEGFYSEREAAVIATTFSVVSITFTIVILEFIGLMNYFVLFYLTVILCGVACAFIMPRIPPLSNIKNNYYIENGGLDESIPEGHHSLSWGFDRAIFRAHKADGLVEFFKDGIKTVCDMWFVVLPVVLAIGTTGTIVAEYTPFFTWIGAPFVPLLEFLNIPEASRAAETLFIGFTDMFLPAILIADVEAEMTRFIIGALSVTQLIYLSEVGGVILASKIPVGFFKLLIIFLLRTAISLPIIICMAHLIF